MLLLLLENVSFPASRMFLLCSEHSQCGPMGATEEHFHIFFPDSTTENWWDHMHWCHFSTTNNTQMGHSLHSPGETDWSSAVNDFEASEQAVCHILLAFWAHPFVFSKGVGTLEVKYSVLDQVGLNHQLHGWPHKLISHPSKERQHKRSHLNSPRGAG